MGLSTLGTAQDEFQYPLSVEAAPAVGVSGTTYSFYVLFDNPTDQLSAVYGNNDESLEINVPEGAFNSSYNSSWSAAGINPAFAAVFPDLIDDTYATVGLDGPASTSEIVGAADPSIVEDVNQPITPFFQNDGSTQLLSNTLIGASWYVLNTAENAYAGDNLKIKIMQVTTTGSIDGTVSYQVFDNYVPGEEVLALQVSVDFNGVGTFYPGGGDISGCTDMSACNYDPSATIDDGTCEDIPAGDCDCDGNQLDALGVCGGSCEADADNDGICDDDPDECDGTLDACGVCDGPGAIYDCGCSDIPAGDCDCDGNQLDALGECGGPCAADADADGICDDVDDCIGELDACGVCNGAGDIYACGCSDIPEGDCDCNGNQLDALDVCGGSCEADADMDGVCDDAEIAGCTDMGACNYSENATDDDGSCLFTGDACDDMNDGTGNDTINENCECVGEGADGVEEGRVTFGMFPNPTTGEVTLTVAGFHTGVTVQVMDGAGRVVYAEQSAVLQGNKVLDLSALSSGTYNVMLSDERGVSVKRLAIQR